MRVQRNFDHEVCLGHGIMEPSYFYGRAAFLSQKEELYVIRSATKEDVPAILEIFNDNILH